MSLIARINDLAARIASEISGARSALNARIDALTALLPDPGSSAGTLTNPPVSVRLGVLDSPTSRPFTNFFKQAWAWEADSGGANWATLVAGGYMTAGGQLISIAPGSNGFRSRFFFGALVESGLSGRWRLRWEGTATWDIYGGSAIVEDVPNEITFDFTADGNSWVTPVVRTIDPAGGQIRNISLVHEDDWADFDEGAIFRRQYLDEVRNYRTLRFDEWIGILRGDTEGGLRIDTWASRPLPTDEIFYRFVPYEWMAALCNAVGADMWLCLPTAADDDHMQQAATLIQTLMPEPRHVWIEYSTKTWDFAGTPQAHYCAEQGRIAFGTTAAPTGQEFRNWYALRSTQMTLWWRDVWGADARLHTTVQHQADVVGGEPDILLAPMWLERDGTLGLPPYVAPHSVIDTFTIHAQIDGGMAYGNAVTQIDEWRTTLTQTEAFNRMRDQMLDAQFFGNTDDGNRNVANMTVKWQHFRDVTETYGMELAVYEAGNHLNGVGGSADTQAFVAAFSVSAQMGEVYTAIFDALNVIGFDGPLCFAVETRYPDPNIVHGLQRWLGDHNAAWAAVETINLVNDGPAGRGANDFVGTYETSGTAPQPGYDDTALVARVAALEAVDPYDDSTLANRVQVLEDEEPEPLRTVNGQNVRGSGNIPTALSFTTDQAAADYSAANPGVAAFSTQAP